jgi:DNA gyrase subunit A
MVVVTRDGKAKRTSLVEYRAQSRDGAGLHTSSASGLVAAFLADAGDELLLLSHRGNIARLPVAEVPRQGRNTAGSHLVTLDTDDYLICALAVPADRR